MVLHDVVKRGKDDGGAGSNLLQGLREGYGIVMPTVIRKFYKSQVWLTLMKFNVQRGSLFERPRAEPDGRKKRSKK